MKEILKRRLDGYNLVEILVVLAIIGILILVALPNHTSTIAKAKAVEAKTQLQHLHSLQTMYFYEHSRYSESFNDLGFEQAALVSEGGNANYEVEIVESSNNQFRALATAVVDFDGDGEFNVWEIDQEKKLVEIAKD